MTFEGSLRKFEGISLVDMDEVRLMNRIDTKYVLPKHLLTHILDDIAQYYFALEIDDQRIFPYESLYYDTTCNMMYNAHHNGKLDRYKVRMRKYVASDLCFLEVKRKVKGTRTLKNRRRIEYLETSLSDNAKQYIGRYTPFSEHELEAKIYTNFQRITLVKKSLDERVTIDTELQFHFNNIERKLEDIAIIELKRDKAAYNSVLVESLKRYRVFPEGFSKYCMGRALVESNIKSNNFKERIRKINKLSNGVNAQHNSHIS